MSLFIDLVKNKNESLYFLRGGVCLGYICSLLSNQMPGNFFVVQQNYMYVFYDSVEQLSSAYDFTEDQKTPGGRGFNPRRGRQHSFVEIDHEIFSTVILSLPLIQEGQLSVSGERMCTVLVNRLED